MTSMHIPDVKASEHAAKWVASTPSQHVGLPYLLLLVGKIRICVLHTGAVGCCDDEAKKSDAPVRHTSSQLFGGCVLSSSTSGQPSWPSSLVKHTKCTAQSLQDCATDMFFLLNHPEQSQLQAVRKKYSQPKHSSVAKTCLAGVVGLAQDFAQARARRPSLANASRRSVGVAGVQDDRSDSMETSSM